MNKIIATLIATSMVIGTAYAQNPSPAGGSATAPAKVVSATKEAAPAKEAEAKTVTPGSTNQAMTTEVKVTDKVQPAAAHAKAETHKTAQKSTSKHADVQAAAKAESKPEHKAELKTETKAEVKTTASNEPKAEAGKAKAVK